MARAKTDGRAADLRDHAGTTRPPLRVRPLAGDQLPMPPQNRVGGDNRGELAQQPTAQTLPAPRQPAPVLIGQAEASSTQLRSEDPVFFDQIRHGLLLLAPPPAGKSHQHEPEPRALHDGGSLHDRHRPTTETEPSAQKWDTFIKRACQVIRLVRAEWVIADTRVHILPRRQALWPHSMPARSLTLLCALCVAHSRAGARYEFEKEESRSLRDGSQKRPSVQAR